MVFIDWYSITQAALKDVWQGLIVFIPKLVGAIIVFVLGWFVSLWVGKLVVGLLEKVKFNRLFERQNWKTAFEKAGLKNNAADFIGEVVKWVLMIVFLLAAVEILGYVQFAVFLTRILDYLGNVVVAALIFVVTAVVVDLLAKVIVAMSESAKFRHALFAGEIVKWAIWIFAIFAILHQLEIAQALVDILFTGIVATLVISFGLAFGLAGKDFAVEILTELRKKIKG